MGARRYTASTHRLHETSRYVDDHDGQVAVFEMQTRRGADLGQSDKGRQHRSPAAARGMEFEVVGVHEAPYRAPDGSSGTRMVVQLRDVTPRPDLTRLG